MRTICSALFGILLICVVSTASAEERLVFGTTPWKAPEKLYQMYQPLMKYLQRQLGKETQFIVTKDYADLIEQIQHKRIDIGIFSPNAYVVAKRTLPGLNYLATPLVKNAEGQLKPYYKGVIFVSKSSPILSIQDLKGKNFGFTDPLSTSGYLFPRVLLIKRGINPETYFSKIFFLKKHDKVISAVVSSAVSGGATADIMFNGALKQHGDILRKIEETDIIPHNAYATGSHMSAEMREAIRLALLNLTPESPVIQKMRENGHYADAYTVMDDHLYDGIREAKKYIPQ